MENKILLQLLLQQQLNLLFRMYPGFFLSTILRHISEEIMKIPPYAACTLPNEMVKVWE